MAAELNRTRMHAPRRSLKRQFSLGLTAVFSDRFPDELVAPRHARPGDDRSRLVRPRILWTTEAP